MTQMEIYEMMKTIKNFCETQKCLQCPFYNQGYGDCIFSCQTPDAWILNAPDYYVWRVTT